jgi:beta-lactamase class A
MKKNPSTNHWKTAALVLIGTNLIVLVWGVLSATRDSIKDHMLRYPHIDVARNFLPQDDYIVNIQPLREKLREMAIDFQLEGGKVSAYVEFLNTGANISINPDTYIWPASLTKVPLALAVMKKIEKGEWTLTNELVLMEGDANRYSGDAKHLLSDFPIGTRFTIEQLLESLLADSDNTAYYILLRNVHQDDLKEVIQALGMEALFTEEGQISAKEYSRILRSLYTASFLTRANSERILEWLDSSKFTQFAQQGVPDDVAFPHKFGEDDRMKAYSDSGIVYIPNRPYILSVMVQAREGIPHELAQQEAAAFMAAFSKEAYQYFSTVEN